MSVAGGAVGLIAGGLLVQYAQLALGVLRQRADRPGRRGPRHAGAAGVGTAAGRFDLPGAITGSLGIALLVYGLSSAATSPNGVSHWGDTKVIVSLVASVVLLVAFGFIETRSKHALVPIRVLRSRDRTGRLPDQLVRRHRAVRHVLLPHALRAGRVGVQRAEDRPRLPADGHHDHGGVRGRVAAGDPDRRPAADDRRQRDHHRRDVLAVPDHREQPLRLRAARADADHRVRHGADLRAALAGRADQGGQQRHGRGVFAC